MVLFCKSLYFNNLVWLLIFFFKPDEKTSLSFVLTSDSKNRLNNYCQLLLLANPQEINGAGYRVPRHCYV